MVAKDESYLNSAIKLLIADESLQKKLGNNASQYVEKNNSLGSLVLTEIHAYNQIME